MEIKTYKPINPRTLKRRAISSFESEQKGLMDIAEALLKFDRIKTSACCICQNADNSNVVVTVFGIDFVECPECGHLYQKYMISEENILSFFKKDTFVNLHVDDEQFQYRLEHVNKPKVDQVLRFIKKKGKWLDAGCGVGELLYYAKSIGFDAYGFDISNPGCAMAKKNGLNVEQGELHQYKEKHVDEKFDVASMIGYLDMVVDPVGHLNTINEMLNDEGVVIIDQPRYDSFSCELIKTSPETSLRYLNPMQRSVFSEKSLLLILEKAHFEPLLLWRIGLDFYEFLSTVCLHMPQFGDSKPFNFLIDHMNSFQKIFDENNASDTMVIIAKKKSRVNG
jgi:2-polyprenyl-3-methyl-5-hydroxy-6-metoxy-1,4-benzoquinol methylase